MKYDACIVGAGIVGLAHAYWAAKKGLNVVVVEKNASCQGASIRNFGLFWAIGQEEEYSKQLAISKNVWAEFLSDTGTWHKATGSLGLAYHADELALIEEYHELNRDEHHRLLSRKEILKAHPYVNPLNLKGGLFSGNEMTMNSREAIPALSQWLTEKYQVHFLFDTMVTGNKLPKVQTNRGTLKAEKLIITSGADFEALYPSVYTEAKITKCKLHMLKTEATLPVIAPALYCATSFIQYPSFSKCESLQPIKKRIMQEQPDYIKYGINLLIAQNNHNELIIGDSHQYGDPVDPFQEEKIDHLILSGIKQMLPQVELKISQRWQGVYAKSFDQKFLVKKPEKNVLIVNALGGAGMTLSFGLAKKTVKELMS
jgi:FAD dependent oxidoreductase TIGR03364